MELKIVDLPMKGYDRVLHATNEITKLDCIIAMHNTKLGPSLGGVRSWSYNSLNEQKEDDPPGETPAHCNREKGISILTLK